LLKVCLAALTSAFVKLADIDGRDRRVRRHRQRSNAVGVYGFGLGTIIAACMTMLAESGVQMTGSRAAGQTVFGLCGDVTGQAIMSIVFTKLGAERFMQAAWLTIAASSALFVIIAQVFVPRMISVANNNDAIGASP
jgi:hypothetical protein